MPPNHNRSTWAFKMAERTSAGAALGPDSPNNSCIWGDSGIDLSVRENTPPPSEISAVS